MFQTPVLLITFNRPTHTQRVFEEIKKQRPKYLYVFQDGAREDNDLDKAKCALVRSIFNEHLNWDCELKTYFSDKNLGCGKGPVTGITWFFEQVEQGLIFEDDCLPHPDFFDYCELLLNKYKENPRISFIGGSSFRNQSVNYSDSYYFSCGSYGTCGWATWKRTWLNFDYYIGTIDKKSMSRLINKYFKEFRQRAYWREIYAYVKRDRLNETCWDYQFYFSCWKNDMLAIIPNVNLITNIGYDEMGTHTFSAEHPAANQLTNAILPIKHPKEQRLNINADFYVHRNFTSSYDYGLTGLKRLPFRINKRLKRLLNHKGSWIKMGKITEFICLFS